MKVLYTDSWERDGNDAWIADKIQIIREDGELLIRHKHKVTCGWAGDDKYTIERELNEYSSTEENQKIIHDYMENQMLFPEMKEPILKDILDE